MRLAVLLFAAQVIACANEANAPSTGATPNGQVRHYGNLHQVMQGQAQAVVSLTDGLRGENAYGLGALSDLRGEFVAVPREIWLSYPTLSESPTVQRADHSDETAALLVATNAVFRDTAIVSDAASDAVEARVAALAEQAGVDASKPFPFLVKGKLKAIHWHVVDGSRVPPGGSHADSSQKGVVEEAEGTVVGFYSTQHQGIFTMQGQNTHMHVFLPALNIAGHVDSIELAAGSTLSVP